MNRYYYERTGLSNHLVQIILKEVDCRQSRSKSWRSEDIHVCSSVRNDDRNREIIGGRSIKLVGKDLNQMQIQSGSL